MDREGYCAAQDQQIAQPEPRQAAREQCCARQRQQHRDDRNGSQRHSNEALEERGKDHEEPRDESRVTRADELQAECLDHVARGERHADGTAEQQLAATRQASHDGRQ